MPLPDTSVKYYDSAMAGAPVLSGVAGTLLGVLDVLVNGFGTVTLNSLVVSGNVATGTVSAGHGFGMIVGSNNLAPGVGPVIRINGATPAALNGDWRLASAPNSTTFTFATEGIADGPASGTITAKRAPAGWTKPFSGANKAVYRSGSPLALGMSLRVDDAPDYSAACVGYESMTDIDTGSGPFPATSSYGFARSMTTTSAARPWVLIADDQLFYLHVDYFSNNYYFTLQGFGDILRANSADATACLLGRGVAGAGGGAPGQGDNNSGFFSQAAAGLIAPRSYNPQSATPVGLSLYSTLVTTWGASSIAYPDAVAGKLILAPLLVLESAALVRGALPGMFAPLNNFGSAAHHKRLDLLPFGSGAKTIVLLAGQNGAAAVAFDLTGPWR